MFEKIDPPREIENAASTDSSLSVIDLDEVGSIKNLVTVRIYSKFVLITFDSFATNMDKQLYSVYCIRGFQNFLLLIFWIYRPAKTVTSLRSTFVFVAHLMLTVLWKYRLKMQ